MERTSRRRIDGGRNVPAEHDARALRRPIHHRHGREQRLRVRMLRGPADLPRIADLHDASEVHHQDPLAEMLHHGEVVGDEQIGQPAVMLEVLQQVDDLRLHAHVESADRFVAHDEPGLDRESPGDADPLALSTAELVRIPVRVLRREPDAPQQFPDPRGPGRAVRHEPMDVQRFADAFADGGPRIQRGGRILEDHLEHPPPRAQRFRWKRRDVLAVEEDGPRRRFDQAQHRAAECRLAAPALADQPHGLARIDGEVDLLDRLHRAARTREEAPLQREADAQVLDFEQRHRADVRRPRRPAATTMWRHGDRQLCRLALRVADLTLSACRNL